MLWLVILLCCIYHYAHVDKHSDGSIKGGLAKNIELNGNNEMFLFDKVEDKRLGNAVSWANKGKQIYAAAEIDSKQRAEKVWGCHKQGTCSWNVQTTFQPCTSNVWPGFDIPLLIQIFGDKSPLSKWDSVYRDGEKKLQRMLKASVAACKHRGWKLGGRSPGRDWLGADQGLGSPGRDWLPRQLPPPLLGPH